MAKLLDIKVRVTVKNKDGEETSKYQPSLVNADKVVCVVPAFAEGLVLATMDNGEKLLCKADMKAFKK